MNNNKTNNAAEKPFEAPAGKHVELVMVRWELTDLTINRTWYHEPKDEDAPHLLQFLVDDGIDLEDAVRAAAKDYLGTDAGKKAFYGNSDNHDIESEGCEYEPFSWMDVWKRIPDEMLARFGVMRLEKEDGGIPVHWKCVDEPAIRYTEAFGESYVGDEEAEWAEGYGFEPRNKDCDGDCGECPYTGKCAAYMAGEDGDDEE